MKKVTLTKKDIYSFLASILDPLKAIGMTFFCVMTLFISSLCVSNGDLTFYSSSYLSLTFFVYGLLAIGIYFAVDVGADVLGESEGAKKIRGSFYSGKLVLFIIGVNVCFIPLMILSGQRERLPLTVVLLASILQLLIIWGYQLIMTALWTDRMAKLLNVKNEMLELFQPTSVQTEQAYQSIVISGALNPLADCILEKIGSQLTYLVLLDQDAIGLAALKSWLTKKFPKLVVATSVVENSHALDSVAQAAYLQELESFFRTYKPEIVFDLDRIYSYRSSQLSDGQSCDYGEDFPAELAYRNIIIPRNLIDVAQKFDSRMVISLSSCPLSTGGAEARDQSFVEAAQTWLECYAQRQDGTQTRVIPLRCHQCSESLGTVNIIMDSLWKKSKKDICLSSSVHNADSIVSLISQLLRNPANHGGVWSLTSIQWVKRAKLQKFINDCKTITEARDGIAHFLSQLPVELLEDSELTKTSLTGAALVKDCPLVDMDFDGMMACFETGRQIEKNKIVKAS